MGIHEHQYVPQDIKPMEALHLLKKGNFRFINNLKLNRDLLEQVNDTKDGQWPFAAILSCMDSRTSAELIFDQGLGDVFSIRIAGNVITEGILGSLEYATAVAGSKLIVVLGHTKCGAIKGACDDVKMGNLTSLIDRIRPAIIREHTVEDNRNGDNPEFVNAVAMLNIRHSVEQIMEKSVVIKELVEKGEVGIIPAMYDVTTGKVSFFDDEAVVKIPEGRKSAKVA